MLAEAERQTPELVRREYVEVYRELRTAGYTAVGEFHYLGFDEAVAAAEAAEEAGIRIVVLLAAYGRGALPRSRQESVAEYLRQVEDLRGRGFPSGSPPTPCVRVPKTGLEEIGRYAAAERLPLHVHADEQPREIEECLADTASGRSSCSTGPVASASGRRLCTQPTPTEPSSTCSQGPARVSAHV